MDFAVPGSRIAALSSGEFVGMVADNPYEPIKLKTFHCYIINDIAALKAGGEAYEELPAIKNTNPTEIQTNFLTIKNDIVDIIETEIQRIKNNADLAHLLFVESDIALTTSRLHFFLYCGKRLQYHYRRLPYSNFQ